VGSAFWDLFLVDPENHHHQFQDLEPLVIGFGIVGSFSRREPQNSV
jgi:hypothetical protein